MHPDISIRLPNITIPLLICRQKTFRRTTRRLNLSKGWRQPIRRITSKGIPLFSRPSMRAQLAKSARILFVVQPGERNVFDQRPLEYKLLEKCVTLSTITLARLNNRIAGTPSTLSAKRLMNLVNPQQSTQIILFCESLVHATSIQMVLSKSRLSTSVLATCRQSTLRLPTIQHASF
jgi:hypothetical protein